MNIVTAIDCYTGYGITGYNIWKNLYDTDPSTTLFNISNPNLEPNWDHKGVLKSIKQQETFDKNSPVLKVWHQYDLLTRPIGTSKYGALSFFETDNITPKERTCYESVDLIITPSQWAKDILLTHNIKTPIEVVAQGVDTNIFDAEIPEDKIKDNYIFINIGKWEKRKGHDVLVEIFNKAFEENDNVELWMVNHNPFLSKDQVSKWYQLYADSKLRNKIRIFPRIPTQKNLSKIMGYSDCGIFPSRGEGWNNEAIEMMAMNKPLIITNYSAHTQYCNKDNSFLIDIKNLEPAKDDLWFDGSGNWASIENDQIDQAVEHMRYVYKNRVHTNTNGLKTAKELSWNRTTSRITELLNN